MDTEKKPFLHPEWIDPDAIEIVRRLQNKGHQSYLVGGCIRDLLCGTVPKDYDIATSAVPNQVKRLIYGSYVIGRRFRLVLVKRGELQFEVATFRRLGTAEDFVEGEEAPLGDNFFGTPEEDALRRDFTVNALFYDPVKDELIDYSQGKKDVDARILRMIGDPQERIKEDPIRTLRAIRFAHKLHFKIEDNLRKAILELSALVGGTILPRRREEYLKILRLENPAAAFIELHDLGVLAHALPGLKIIFEDEDKLGVFLSYLRRIPEFVGDSPTPTELYIPFILGYREALGLTAPFEEKEEEFLRTELGVFRSEYGEISAIFEMRDRLQDIDLFNRRGARRKQAFLENPLFPRALRVATFEHELSPETFLFWKEQLAAD
jgi:poly(A) polymerase